MKDETCTCDTSKCKSSEFYSQNDSLYKSTITGNVDTTDFSSQPYLEVVKFYNVIVTHTNSLNINCDIFVHVQNYVRVNRSVQRRAPIFSFNFLGTFS